MKKMLLVLLAFAFSFAGYAQEGKMPKKDHLMLQDGKMWVMKQGTTAPLEADQTLGNGATVTIGGKVTTKEGTTFMLEEGDAIDMDGIITKTNTKSTTKKEKMK